MKCEMMAINERQRDRIAELEEENQRSVDRINWLENVNAAKTKEAIFFASGRDSLRVVNNRQHQRIVELTDQVAELTGKSELLKAEKPVMNVTVHCNAGDLMAKHITDQLKTMGIRFGTK